jgi:hypothetical protein
MGNRAAQDGRMQHSLACKVRDVFTWAAQEAKILDPLNWGADVAVDEAHRSSLLQYAVCTSTTASMIGM